jgi:hypothetical protein
MLERFQLFRVNGFLAMRGSRVKQIESGHWRKWAPDRCAGRVCQQWVRYQPIDNEGPQDHVDQRNEMRAEQKLCLGPNNKNSTGDFIDAQLRPRSQT